MLQMPMMMLIGDACQACFHDKHDRGSCPGGYEPYPNDDDPEGPPIATWASCMCPEYVSYEDRGNIEVVIAE